MTRLQKVKFWFKDTPVVIMVVGGLVGGMVNDMGFGLITPNHSYVALDRRVSALEKGLRTSDSAFKVHIDSGTIKSDRRDRQFRSILIILCRMADKDRLGAVVQDAQVDCENVLTKGSTFK